MRAFFGGLFAVLMMTLPAAMIGCAPGDEPGSTGEDDEVVDTASSAIAGVAARYDVSSLTAVQRQKLADAEGAYLNDTIVAGTAAAVESTSFSGEREARTYFLGIRSRVQAMEAYLSGTDAASTLQGGRMPSWDTTLGAPLWMRGADPHDDGTPRSAIANPTSSLTAPSFSCDSLPWFQDNTYQAGVVRDWKESYVQTTFAGALYTDADAPAAMIYWPLLVDVAQHYEAWENCHAFPSAGVVDDTLSGWTTSGPGSVTLVSDDGGAPWSNVFRIAGASTGVTTLYRDVSISAGSIGLKARLVALTRTSSEACAGGRPKARLSFFNGSTLISTITGDEATLNAWTPSDLAATIPAGTTKIRMNVLVSARPDNLACTGQYASADDVRLMVY